MLIYSSRCAYGIRGLTRLAILQNGGYVLLEDVVAGTDLPRFFLAKIFQDLVRQKMLVSAKGRGGGFALARPAREILLLDIVEKLDGLAQFSDCVAGYASCSEKSPCPNHEAWGPVRDRIKQFLTETTLEQMGQTMRFKLEALGQTISASVGKPAPKPASRSGSKRRHASGGKA
jgi:Rrf2 family transcriptional regulator, iron-sulfur cluster assembly transcription factor